MQKHGQMMSEEKQVKKNCLQRWNVTIKTFQWIRKKIDKLLSTESKHRNPFTHLSFFSIINDNSKLAPLFHCLWIVWKYSNSFFSNEKDKLFSFFSAFSCFWKELNRTMMSSSTVPTISDRYSSIICVRKRPSLFLFADFISRLIHSSFHSEFSSSVDLSRWRPFCVSADRRHSAWRVALIIIIAKSNRENV